LASARIRSRHLAPLGLARSPFVITVLPELSFVGHGPRRAAAATLRKNDRQPERCKARRIAVCVDDDARDLRPQAVKDAGDDKLSCELPQGFVPAALAA
jgi:hypothetical protein